MKIGEIILHILTMQYLLKHSLLKYSGSHPPKYTSAVKGAALHTAAPTNINCTVHITYQLIGRSMFLYGGYYCFVRGRQCLLVELACACQND